MSGVGSINVCGTRERRMSQRELKEGWKEGRKGRKEEGLERLGKPPEVTQHSWAPRTWLGSAIPQRQGTSRPEMALDG